jgi:glycosyltransferase involved in cell wall biosynthesis
MRRLKVLFITAWYPTMEMPVRGVFVREHAKAVQLYDDVVVLHCAGVNPGLKTLWQLEREPDENLTENLPTYRIWQRGSRVPHISYANRVSSTLKAIWQIAGQGFVPDIIHAHIYSAGPPAVIAGKIKHIPVVVTEHSSAFPRKLLSKSQILLARVVFQTADIVLPVSHALQKAIEQYGIQARFSIVPNLFDSKLFSLSSDPPEQHTIKRLLFVGSLIPVKGISHLLHALDQLQHQRSDWHLDLVGDGASAEDYKRLVAALGLTGKVTFHGRRSKREVSQFMRQADLFVLPSLWDNLPCVLVEAMASGLPIVSTDVGGIPEITNERTGKLVTPGDAGALCEALNDMLDNLGRYSRKRISEYATERFSPERVGGEFDRIYRSLLSARAPNVIL